MPVASIAESFSENSASSKETCNLKLPRPLICNLVLSDSLSTYHTRQLTVSISRSYHFSWSLSYWKDHSPESKPVPGSVVLLQSADLWFLLLVVTTLTQRLAQPEFQTELVSELFPAHKHLMIKRSQRCRNCEHNVSKPEFNPGSIKFKIQLAA